MKDSKKIARAIIEEGEGDRLKAYQDTVGKWTIGRGRNLEDRGISQPESDLLFANDIEEAFAVCRSEFGFFKTLTAVRQAVVVDLYHNLGLSGLMSFKKFLRAIQIGDYDEAANQIKDSKYYGQVGIRAQRNMLMIRFDKFFSKEEARSYFINQKE